MDSTVRRPAEAEKFRLEKIAEANKNRLIMEAEAEAEAGGSISYFPAPADRRLRPVR